MLVVLNFFSVFTARPGIYMVPSSAQGLLALVCICHLIWSQRVPLGK